MLDTVVYSNVNGTYRGACNCDAFDYVVALNEAASCIAICTPKTVTVNITALLLLKTMKLELTMMKATWHLKR